jgi:CBS-domain-containing membrane protein
MADPEILPDDLRAALKAMHGYVDITEADLQEIYRLALDHARRRLQEEIRVGEVMTREVVSVQAGTDSHQAEALLFRHRVSGLPVVDADRRVVGVVSEKDFLYRLEDDELFTFMDRLKRYLHRHQLERKIHGDTVDELMTAPAITVTPDTPLGTVATLLVERGINRVPVVDADGRLQGIISRADLVRVLHHQGQGEEGQ